MVLSFGGELGGVGSLTCGAQLQWPVGSGAARVLKQDGRTDHGRQVRAHRQGPAAASRISK